MDYVWEREAEAASLIMSGRVNFIGYFNTEQLWYETDNTCIMDSVGKLIL